MTVGGRTGDEDRLPAEFVSLGSAARSVVEATGRADAWDAPTRAAALAWLARHRDLVALAEGRVLAAEQRAGTWARHGDRDLASFMGRLSHQGRGAGAAAVGQAATLQAMPQVAEAMADGPVTTRHLAEITRAAGASPALAEQFATEAGQRDVVVLAGRLDGAAFGKQLAAMGAALDPAARQRSHDEQRAGRFVHLTHTAGGTVVNGRLDLVAGHRLAKAMEAFSPRPAADDERDRGQRQADALAAVAERALADRAPSVGIVAPVQALITFTEATWTALRASSSGPTTAAGTIVDGPGSAARLVGALRGVDPVVDQTGTPWPASEVGRALCDCVLTRAVVGTGGQVLDLGRDARLFTRAHWLAMFAAGQRTCAVEGCGMPLAYTELHHIRWWDRDGGATDLDGCAPECSYHHHQIHRLDLRVARRPDGSYEHRYPDGRLYGAAPPCAEAPPGPGEPVRPDEPVRPGEPVRPDGPVRPGEPVRPDERRQLDESLRPADSLALDDVPGRLFELVRR